MNTFDAFGNILSISRYVHTQFYHRMQWRTQRWGKLGRPPQVAGGKDITSTCAAPGLNEQEAKNEGVMRKMGAKHANLGPI